MLIKLSTPDGEHVVTFYALTGPTEGRHLRVEHDGGRACYVVAQAVDVVAEVRNDRDGSSALKESDVTVELCGEHEL